LAVVRIPKISLADGLEQARALAWPVAEVA